MSSSLALKILTLALVCIIWIYVFYVFIFIFEKGVYAPDAEAYVVFASLFDPIIEEYHGGFGKDQHHPPSDFGDASAFEDLDPENKWEK